MFRLRHQDLRDEIDMAAEALKRNPASPASVVPEVTLSRSEIRELESLAATLRNRPRAPRLKIKAERGKPLHIGVAAPIDAARLNAVFGTAESGFADLMLAGLLNAACDGGPSNPPSERSINQVLAAVTGVGARDEVEGMLATQMVATHFAAVTLLRRLKGAENIPSRTALAASRSSCCGATPPRWKPCSATAAKDSRSSPSSTSTFTRVARRLSATSRGAGCQQNRRNNPMQRHSPLNQARRCRARSKRSGKPCQAPAVNGWAVCRMHGAGAPKGNKNALRHGRYTGEALALRQAIRALLCGSRELVS